jgi:hypothetical protein
MLESGSSGSVRGVPRNGHPHRNPGPEADLRVSTRYRGIVKLQATTAGVRRDTAEASFQRPGGVNSSVRTPAWQVNHVYRCQRRGGTRS